ncbi:MFS transporter [Candidatus Kaiserbacteria bacterium]|nr:MFS transporter [Candidatus Kaiserbacteria bacterium]
MRPRTVIYIGNFFFSLFIALITFILLPYVSSFIPEAYAGLVISGGALIAVILFPLMPKLVERHGAQRLVLAFAVLEMLALLALATTPGPITGILLIAVAVALQPFIAYELDILLETTVIEEHTTGRVRAIFLTAWNIAALAAPLLVGALLARSDAYEHVFLIAAVALVPFIVLLTVRNLPRGVTPKLPNIWGTLLCIVRDRDLFAVTFGHFLLYMFFVWAPFYIPVYLHTDLEIPWSDLGWVFSIMLLPYVLIQYPAGLLADKVFGDKELMFAGFVLTGLSFATIGFFTASTPLMVIIIVLFVSRVGAALIEGMTEGHFFRRMSEKDVNAISVFRGIWPFTEFIAPIIGSAILIFGNFELFFIFTGGFIAVAGAISTLLIKDFR